MCIHNKTRPNPAFVIRQDCQPSLRSAVFHRIELTQSLCTNLRLLRGLFVIVSLRTSATLPQTINPNTACRGFVVSPRIELGSGASETLILSIVLRNQ